MRLFLDTEFNGFGGQLISLALVDEDGAEFYRSLPLPHPQAIHPWVREHVVPKLGNAEVPYDVFAAELHRFLLARKDSTVICDWFEDATHLLSCFSRGSLGIAIKWHGKIEIVNSDGFAATTDPHNALADARDLRDWYLGC